MRNVSSTFSPGLKAGGCAAICTGYSLASGIPAISFMPQRGHTPGVFELMSRSIGHMNPTVESGTAEGPMLAAAQEPGDPSAQVLSEETCCDSGVRVSSAQSTMALTRTSTRAMKIYYDAARGLSAEPAKRQTWA